MEIIAMGAVLGTANSTPKMSTPNSTPTDEAPACPSCGQVTHWKTLQLGEAVKHLPAYCDTCWDEIQEHGRRMQEAERQEAARAARKAHIDELLEQSRLGARYAACTFDNWQAVAGTEGAVRICQEFAANKAGNKGDGLIITGPTGCGKTHLAAAIVRDWASAGYAAIFQSVPELLARLRATYDPNSSDAAEAAIMDALGECDLLVLDDVGAEKQSAWTEEKLYLLIDRRYRENRPTVLTTNLDAPALEKALGSRAMDRLLETCGIVRVQAKSFRRTRRDKDNGRG